MGISTDSVASHRKFADKYGLAVTLLSDSDKEAVQRYRVKNLIGFANRKSFLIDPQGILRKIYDSVSPANHAGEVLEDLKALQEAG